MWTVLSSTPAGASARALRSGRCGHPEGPRPRPGRHRLPKGQAEPHRRQPGHPASPTPTRGPKSGYPGGAGSLTHRSQRPRRIDAGRWLAPCPAPPAYPCYLRADLATAAGSATGCIAFEQQLEPMGSRLQSALQQGTAVQPGSWARTAWPAGSADGRRRIRDGRPDEPWALRRRRAEDAVDRLGSASAGAWPQQGLSACHGKANDFGRRIIQARPDLTLQVRPSSMVRPPPGTPHLPVTTHCSSAFQELHQNSRPMTHRAASPRLPPLAALLLVLAGNRHQPAAGTLRRPAGDTAVHRRCSSARFRQGCAELHLPPGRVSPSSRPFHRQKDPVAVRSWALPRPVSSAVRIKAGSSLLGLQDTIRAASRKVRDTGGRSSSASSVSKRSMGAQHQRYQTVSRWPPWPSTARVARCSGRTGLTAAWPARAASGSASYQGLLRQRSGLAAFLPSSASATTQWTLTGQGQIDLLGSPADAIGSVARYIKGAGRNHVCRRAGRADADVRNRRQRHGLRAPRYDVRVTPASSTAVALGGAYQGETANSGWAAISM